MKKITLFNSTSIKRILILLFLLSLNTSFGQFFTTHNVAPAPWSYYSDANELVVATESTTSVSVTVRRSNGTLVTNLSTVKGNPAIYRFSGSPLSQNYLALNSILNDAGLTITSTKPTSVNLRNVASDNIPGNQNTADTFIKGNASLTSFGNAGLGISFRIGYYRDGTLGTFGVASLGNQLPIYSAMAVSNNTIVKLNGVNLVTLNAGQSYLFQAALGSLVESSSAIVMNTGSKLDNPSACGDGTFDQLPPTSVLGKEYIIVRTLGTSLAEQTTIVATEPNTTITLSRFSLTGSLISNTNVTLTAAGNFYTFSNGDGTIAYSSNRIVANKKVAVYSGSAQSCEVDISTVAPTSACGGSYFVETSKFKKYDGSSLPYFGFILTQSATAAINVNGVNLETLTTPRRQLGSSGWYLINFNNDQISNPNIISIASTSRLTVSIIQQGGGFSMSAFFSNFVEQPDPPTLVYSNASDCSNGMATLSTNPGFAPYQWYLNGTAITGATSNIYIANQNGAYTVAATLSCGEIVQSPPVNVAVCTDIRVVKTVNNLAPVYGSNVTFTLAATNLGPNIASNVVINDILPTGYTLVSATPTSGNWTNPNWTIGTLNVNASVTMTVVATVNLTGNYANTACISAENNDPVTGNNCSTITPIPVASTDLAITKIASTLSPIIGSNVTFTITATNNGPNAATGVVVNDVLPSGYTLVSATPSVGTWNSPNWSVGNLTNGSSANIVIIATVKPTGNYSNTACVSGNQTDSVSGNNCATSTPIPVNAVINAINDAGTSVNGYTGGTALTNVLANDTLNGVAVVPSQVTTTFVASTNPGVTLSGTNVVVAAGTPAGTYTLTYQICQVTNPTNCDTAIVTVPVGAPTIDAVNDAGTSVNGYTGGTALTNVLANDTLNGVAVVPSQVTTTFVASTNAGITLSGTNVVVAAGTPAGTYTLTYQICQVTNPTNCDTAIVTVPVGAPTIDAVNDAGTSVNGYTGGTALTNVLANDTLNGVAVVPSQVTTTFVASTNAGITLSGTNVVVAAGTPAGTYTLTYQICQVTNPTNCDTAIVTVPVGAPTIDAVNDAGTSVNGYTGGTALTNVLANDTLNGVAVVPSQVTTTFVASTNAGITLSGTNVVVAAGTPAGTYTLTYQICQVTNPTNCDTAIVTVPVGAPTIDAVNDAGTSVNGYTGGTALTNVLANDTLNGVAVVPSQVTTTFVASTNAGITLSGTNVVVAAGTPAGTYTLTYQICQVTNPTNCDTAIVTVPVGAPTIDAVNDAGTSVNGYTGGTALTNVLANDTLNGVAVVPSQVTTTFVASTNAGITLSGTNVVVAAGTPAGTYTLTYQICQVTNPTNCDTAIVTVPVGAPTIDAVNDAGTSVNGYTGGTALTNVLANDTLNGVAVVPSQVTTTFVASTNAGITLSGTNVVVAAGTPAGTYTLTYQICQVTNPTNCDTAIVTVPVGAPTIDAVNDAGTSVNGYTGGTALTNVLANDTLNGVAVVPSQVTTTFVASTNAGITLSGTNVVVAAGTPAGTYTLTYQICQVTNPTNCDTAIVTVPVGAPTIDAVNDAGTSVNGYTGGTALTNVLANDTLNGVAVVPSQVTTTFVASTNPGVTLSGTNVVVAAGTPAGTYTLTYQICQVTNPTNCDTAIVTVPVGAPTIDAVNDAGTSVNGYTGGTALTNVLANDTLNGVAVVPSQVTTTFVASTNAGITLSGTNVVVAAGTPAGTYTLTYQICQVTNPTNCDTAIVTVPVGAPTIDAVNDAGTSVNGYTGGTALTNVLANDTLNGVAVVPSQVTTTFVASTNAGITLSGTNVVVAAGTPAGTYTLTYQICQVTNPTNCDTAIVTVPVGAPTIDAVNDAGTSVNGYTGGTALTNVLANDTLNGVAVVPSQVTTTFVASTNAGITLSGTNVVVAAGTPAGTYTLTYQICQVTNPTNCDTAIVTVPVGAPTIDAVNDAGTSVNGYTGGTALTNVLANDTLNGVAVVPSQVTTTFVASTNPGVTLSGTNVVVAAGTPAGTYTLTYQICQVTNPTNCDTAIVTVPVGAPTIDAVNDAGTSVNGYTGGTALTNVLANDTLNGVAVVPSQVTTTFVASTNAGITLSGTNVVVAAGTPAGTYTLTYQICQVTNPTNCDTAIVTVPVGAPTIDAVNDAGTSVNGYTGGTALTNVLANDTLNGVAVVPSQVTTTFVASTNAGVTLSGTNVVVAAGTPAGTYTLTYQICQVTNPTNCDTAIVTVPVGAPTIDAVNDAGTSVNGYTGGTALTNVLANDTLNGVAVVPSQVTTTFVASTNAGITLSGTNVVVAAGTPAGTYTLTYQICQVTNPTNCDTAIVTVPVGAPTIDAVNDAGTSVNGYTGGTALTNVLANDTLNGVAVVPSQVTTTFVASTNAGITLSGTNVVVAAGTPAGTYTLTYQICQVTNPTNCDTAIVTVPVGAPTIDAVNDAGTSVNGYTGGTALTNVLANDTLNGVAVVPSQVTTTFVASTNAGITLSGTNVVVAAGTPAGTYTLTYQICQVTNPTNCDTAIVTVPVGAPTIDAVNDAGTSVNGYTGGTALTNVLANDTLNGVAVVPSQVTTTFVASTNAGITLSGTNVVVAAGTPAGTYTLTYQICQVTNPTNCDTAIVTVPVGAPTIDAVNDAGTSVNGYTGGTALTNVLANDTLNGVAVVPSQVTTTFVASTNAGITLSGTNVVVAAGTPAGTYTLTYQICQVTNPTNCDTAIVTVPVGAPTIDAVNDAGTSVNGYTGGTALTNVLANDTLNGVAVVPSQVTTTFVASTNAGITLSGTNVVVAAGTPAGTYTLTYQICQVTNPTNCDTAIVTVPVGAPTIDAVNDAGTSVNGYTGGTALTNVLANDTLNGVAVVPSQVTTTFVASTNPGVTLSGTNVVVAAGTPAGTYTLTYQICQVTNPTNCDTAIVTVPVGAPTIDAVNDAGTSVNGYTGGTALTNVLANDTLNGVAVVPSQVTTTFVASTNPGVTLSGTNVVVAAGTPAGTYTLTYQICQVTNPTNCDTAIVTVTVYTPSIELLKEGTYVDSNLPAGVSVGDTITYAFTVTNTSTIALTNITVTDPLVTVIGGPLATLAPGASNSTTFTAVYTVTQADIDAGQVNNLATATGAPPSGPPVTDTSSDPTPCNTCEPVVGCPTCTSTDLPANPSIKLLKDGAYVDTNGDGITNVGDTITYTFVVTNTGNVTLTNVTISDNNAVILGGPIPTLAVNQSDSTTFTAVHIITQADIDAGQVNNLAIATGTPPFGPQVTDNSSDPTPCTTCNPIPTCTDCTITPLINAINDTFNNVACDVSLVVGNILTNDTFGVTPVNTNTASSVSLTILSGNYPNISISTNGNINLASGIAAGTYTFTYKICSLIVPNVCDQASVTINIIDTTIPVWTSSLPQNSTVNCTNIPVVPILTATDSCGNATVTFNTVTTLGNCPGNYVITNTWTATDASGNLVTHIQVITVQDTTAPVIAALPATSTISCPATPVFATATATDECGSAFTLTFADVTTNGTCTGSYAITRTWTATDACGNSSTASQTINVQDTTAPVIAALPATSTISCPATPVFATATATDNCGSAFTLTFADVTTNGTCTGSYAITRTWTATDACGNSSTASQTINVQDTTAPVIAALPATSTISCPATPVFATATATDNCGSAFTLTFADVTTNGTCTGSYAITRTWTATDACGNSSTASQTINVQDTTAPVIAVLPATSTISCPATPVFATATATDECGSAFTLTFVDVTTNGTCTGSYAITRTWTATDACGNSSTASQTINVQDTTAPVIAALPATSTISCPATPVFATATATDNCGSAFTLTFADVTTNGTCTGSYAITRTWTATDACGNSSTASQTINVQDTTAPVIAVLPATSTISCPATPVFAPATATDECGSAFTLTFVDVTTNGTCTGSYAITRTWTATDACGNSSTASQTINVQDTTAPVLTTPFNANEVATCESIPPMQQLVFTDGCSSASQITVVTNETTSNINTDGSYTIIRTWTVSDSCNNTSIFTQTINVTVPNYFRETTVDAQCDIDIDLTVNVTEVINTQFPGVITANGTWTDVNNSNALSTDGYFTPYNLVNGNYIIRYENNDLSCPRIVEVTIPVDRNVCTVAACITLDVHNAFSPNGDNTNELFIIDNITDPCYIENTVEIYNRWGVKVFEVENYNNQDRVFRGISEGRSTIKQSSELPTGTYFYILKYKTIEGNYATKNGYLYLSR